MTQSLDSLASVLDTTLDPLAVLTPVRDDRGAIVDFVVESVNEVACEIRQWPRDVYCGTRLLEVFPTVAEMGLFHEYVRVAETGEPFAVEFARYRTADMDRTFHARATRVGDCIAVSWHDVTEHERLAARTELQGRLLDVVDAAIIATDHDLRILYWSKGAERLYGWREDEVLGRTTHEVLAPNEPPTWVEQTRAAIDAGSEAIEFDLRRKDGTALSVVARTSPLVEDGETVGYLGVSVDVTERRAVDRSLRETRDFLAALTDSMGEGMFALDTSGHVSYMNPAAEQILGWTLDTVPGAPMHDVIHHEHADGSPFPATECPLRLARTSGTTIRVPRDTFIRRDGTHVPVSYIASPVQSGESSSCVVVFRDVSDEVSEELRIERELDKLAWIGRIQDALDNDRFVLYEQPIIDLATNDVVQHELLLRMLDADGQTVLPGVFLPTAEEFGLVRRIDHWVARQALALAARGTKVEFNLSGRSIGDPAILDLIRDAAVADPALPSRLVCEITETALMSDAADGEAFVRALRTLGCPVALDDFGAGYGGFAYLKRLPVSYLKIDTQFVRDALVEPTNQHVIRSVVSLAAAFSLKTIAEGAENRETIDLLRELGVDYAQGNAVAAPRLATQAIGVGAA